LRICKGKYILFLDNDTIMIEKSLSKMIDFMKSDNNVGLLGPKLINSDSSLQLSCRRFPTFFQPFASRVKILRKIAYFRNLLAWHLMEEFDHNSIVEVDYVLGACYLIQRKVFETVKFFDNKFFFGPDDCDYALRIWQKGFKVVYFPSVSIVHQHRRRTTKMGLMVIKHMIAMLYFFWKHKYLFRPAIYPRSIIE
jgi:GT2 family glycosyltransferase